MSDLDDKLKEILDGRDGPIVTDSEIAEAIAQIKQAFTDAGWVEFTDEYMTGQEAFERLKKAGLLGHDLEVAREALLET